MQAILCIEYQNTIFGVFRVAFTNVLDFDLGSFCSHSKLIS